MRAATLLSRCCTTTTSIPTSTSSTVQRCIHTSVNVTPKPSMAALPLHTGRERLVILGVGWGGARLIRDIDTDKYDITVISPRNHFVFTPLLSSACVGTLESRAVTLAVSDLQRALKAPQNYYFAADAVAIHPQEKIVEARSLDGLCFSVDYSKLAIATGSQGSTFGIPGVLENAHFLRDAANAEAIRSRIIFNWHRANVPGRSSIDRDHILHTVVVGGGPTGVEFAGDLADFIRRDLSKIDPDRAHYMRITLIEASQLLGSFDVRLREYAAGRLAREGVHLVKAVVKEVRPTELELQSGEVIPFGLCVWSTGVGPTPFTLSLPFTKTSKGRIAVDECLRVMMPHIGGGEGGVDVDVETEPCKKKMSDFKFKIGDDEEENSTAEVESKDKRVDFEVSHGVPVDDIFALGDCCANMNAPLPALAQVAEQQGKYLAKVLNGTTTNKFEYRSLGAMATVGGRSAVLELEGSRGRKFSWAGFSSFIAWRSAYLTRLGSFKARVYVAFNWTVTLIFGRDISRW